MIEFVIAILAKLFQLLLPALLAKASDTCEDGSDIHASRFKKTIKAAGWSAENIAATNPKGKK